MRTLWQLPQILLNRLLSLIAKPVGLYIHGIPVWATKWKLMTAISLGDRIIAHWDYVHFDSVLSHEYGHCRQSLILGPLYLPIVGLPSLVMNILTRVGVLSAARYYNRWPENWADRLGGVNRQPVVNK